jgi:DNA ligase (NAD+)
MIDSIEKARNTTLQRLIYALGIPGFGVANAKMICKQYDYDLTKLKHTTKEELAEVDGIGEVLAGDFVAYFENDSNKDLLERLLAELKIERPEKDEASEQLVGVNFVITGSVEHFTNRNEVKELIESLGGKVTGSVTGKTNYLINNDVNSTSGKNKKAKELGVAIISEERFMEMIGRKVQ